MVTHVLLYAKGVTACHPHNHDYVSRWRRQSFLEAREALVAMGKIGEDRPAAQNLTVLFLLFTRRLKFDVQKQV